MLYCHRWWRWRQTTVCTGDHWRRDDHTRAVAWCSTPLSDVQLPVLTTQVWQVCKVCQVCQMYDYLHLPLRCAKCVRCTATCTHRSGVTGVSDVRLPVLTAQVCQVCRVCQMYGYRHSPLRCDRCARCVRCTATMTAPWRSWRASRSCSLTTILPLEPTPLTIHFFRTSTSVATVQRLR